MSSFALCIYGGQRAIKYYHNYGDFEFLLLKAEDGTSNIHFGSTKALNQGSLDTIGRESMALLKKTADAFKIEVENEIITFDDAVDILKRAQQYSQHMK